MKVIHTADWHLGHSLHGVSREYEHEEFLAWLLGQLEEQMADALIVAGDIFDSANPPASAQSMLYAFLRDAKRALPGLDIVLIAGNHDSGSRLSAPAPILDAFGVHVIGGLPRRDDLSIDWSRLCAPLTNAQGQVAAWCGAMPFLRSADLPIGSDDEDPLIDGVRIRYQELFEVLREAAGGDVPMIATGHCYMTGTQLSELSERRILGGNQHALPVDIFPDDIAYAALGHLHLAQRVGQRDAVRYSGSPIPLSIDEHRYRHQVAAVEIDGKGVSVQPLHVPRAVGIHRIPTNGPADIETVVEQLAELVLDTELPPERHPYLEIRVRLEKPEPGLRQRLEESLAGRPVRLLKVTTTYTGTNDALADAGTTEQLEMMAPEDVFVKRYARSYEDEPSDELLGAFASLLESLQGTD
ncbi:MAG: exonuclease SbcCD subunit D C-terminal domain-containing protein [Candidatus Thiodiazotropha lotti]|nr:exonuclease SbcCD subunit D C-terminal domain-containing protein [Candidatus Thiodiazotropha lotti]